MSLPAPLPSPLHAPLQVPLQAALPESCPNCAHPVSGPYCSSCGQTVHIETPTLFEFIHEYLHHYVAVDGTLWHTLWLLLSQPGKLTTEYLLGRRKRYIKPLQLYLTISFIFFVVLGFTDQGRNLVVLDKDDAVTGQVGAAPATGAAAAGAAGADAAASGVVPAVKPRPFIRPGGSGPAITVSEGSVMTHWADQANRRIAMFGTDSERASEELWNGFRSRAPYGVFILMPIFALLLGLAWRRRHQRYGAHLVFALHMHAFIFILFFVALLPFVSGFWVALGALAYLLLAQKRMYGGRWLPLVARTLLVLLLYGVATVLVLSGLLIQAFVA